MECHSQVHFVLLTWLLTRQEKAPPQHCRLLGYQPQEGLPTSHVDWCCHSVPALPRISGVATPWPWLVGKHAAWSCHWQLVSPACPLAGRLSQIRYVVLFRPRSSYRFVNGAIKWLKIHSQQPQQTALVIPPHSVGLTRQEAGGVGGSSAAYMLLRTRPTNQQLPCT